MILKQDVFKPVESLKMFEMVPTWILLLAAVPAAWLGFKLIVRGFRRAAFLWVRMEKATKILLYELTPNDGDSLFDKVEVIRQITNENQRALEMHLLDHGEEKTE